jgi:L-amino acid N-acyltransferase YncA
MTTEHRIIDITPENVGEFDLLCVKSKKNSEGYQNKLKWFKERYSEGLRIKLLWVNDRGKMTSRGLIEYIPSEYAWRVIEAKGYNVIHCLWVVGKWKKMGFGRQLLASCIDDSKASGKVGVTAVASEGNWLVSKKIFLRNGFAIGDEAPPSFSLLVKKFNDIPNPSFPTNWKQRANQFGSGLTVIYTDQCPYQPDAAKMLQQFADENEIEFKVVKFSNSKELRQRSPSPYGVFSIVYNGELISYTYEKKSKLTELINQ